MKIGLCVVFDDITKMREKFKTLRREDFTSCQLLAGKPALWTDENAAQLNALLTECEIEISAFWCGWEAREYLQGIIDRVYNA